MPIHRTLTRPEAAACGCRPPCDARPGAQRRAAAPWVRPASAHAEAMSRRSAEAVSSRPAASPASAPERAAACTRPVRTATEEPARMSMTSLSWLFSQLRALVRFSKLAMSSSHSLCTVFSCDSTASRSALRWVCSSLCEFNWTTSLAFLFTRCVISSMTRSNSARLSACSFSYAAAAFVSSTAAFFSSCSISPATLSINSTAVALRMVFRVLLSDHVPGGFVDFTGVTTVFFFGFCTSAVLSCLA
mmetsp:Transcript_121950/g.339965  ORF Transcript_121950/g.339965 Transcript_121950/m.339965 type:complete len:246 (-) Transcript_121950:577-1314(-)